MFDYGKSIGLHAILPVSELNKDNIIQWMDEFVQNGEQSYVFQTPPQLLPGLEEILDQMILDQIQSMEGMSAIHQQRWDALTQSQQHDILNSPVLEK